MPLLLDDTMNVEEAMDVMGASMALDDVDLFGDPVIENPLSLPPPPAPSKPLQQRLDELRARGCCQQIAWSKQGTIASVSKDGQSIELRFLRCHPENGSWELSEPSPCSALPQAVVGGPVTHLLWNAQSSPELAVFDAVGRVSILSFSINLNRTYPIRKWDVDSVDDLHAVVGAYWLPLVLQSRQASARDFNLMYGPAIWTQTEYKYESLPVPAFGPFHPNPAKSSLLCVTNNGLLKLFFSQSNNKVEETTLELESVTSSDDLITHASLCSDKNTLLIALATASKQLKVIRTNIRWGKPDASEKQVPPGSVHLSPTLEDRHIATTSWLQHGPSESPLDQQMSQLSHIEVLPSCLEGLPTPGQTWAPAVVLTVRSYIPPDSSAYGHEVQSIIDRWEILNEQTQQVHDAFEQLGLKNGSGASPPAMCRLHKLPSIVIPKIILSIHTMQFGKVICFAFSDGTIQYRDRLTMDEIYNEHDVSRIISPHQVGFQFGDETPCLQVAFSPTNCSFIQICEDNKVKWNSMRYQLEDPNDTVQGGQYAAVLAALSVATSSAASNQTNYDDILATARPFTKKRDFTYAWTRELVNMLKIAVDYSEDSHHDQLVRNTQLQMCLSILNHLGFKGDFQPRSFGGKFAMLALNVRNIVVLITVASNSAMSLKERLSPLDEPEVVDALAGCAKWALDLLAWLTDCLFSLLDDPKFMSILSDPKHFSELASHLQAENDVSLHLILCSSTRGLLSAVCRRLLHLDALSSKAITYYENKAAQQTASDPAGAAARQPSALYQAYQKMQRFTSSSLVKVLEFDKLIGALGADIRGAYQSSLSVLATKNQPQPPQAPTQQQGAATNDPAVKKAQAQIELDMLLAANPPPAFREVLHRFFTEHLRAFRDQTDPAKLYFADFSLLEVEDDRTSLGVKKSRGRYIDVFKRVELVVPDPTNEAARQWRRCARCASVMEDLMAQRPGFTFVLAQQRKCSCGGNWGLLLKGTKVS
ncbi:RNA polymerase II mediator complex subunit Sin4 [Thozetella sp. PMI_491]|nr:RNA polymerase II mediator complex subunit Sin4 [Thozetella sp. PMI_491]